jgi:outer membrane immunogenic protein
MKRIFIAGAFLLAAAAQASAADMPMPGPPVPPPAYIPVVPYYNWTGFYLGINGGGAFGNSNWTDPIDGPSGNFTVSGFLIGGTAGFNYQIGSWVLGVEGDGAWANLNGTTFNASCITFGCTTQSNWLATARGRAGYAWDRVYLYGTGGAAFANVQAAFGALPLFSSTQAGWTAGVGVEYAIWPNWTAKLEYLYVNLANASCPAGNCAGGTGLTPPTPVATTVSLNENIIRGGFNFKFGW